MLTSSSSTAGAEGSVMAAEVTRTRSNDRGLTGRTVRSLLVRTPVRAIRRAVAQVPRAVLAATLLFALLLALWSTALPLGDAPDETAHADLVFHLATGAPYPHFD